MRLHQGRRRQGLGRRRAAPVDQGRDCGGQRQAQGGRRGRAHNPRLGREAVLRPQTHKVTWAIKSREGTGAGQGEGVNFNTLTLGRYGYISMNLVTALAQLPGPPDRRPPPRQPHVRRGQPLRRFQQHDRQGRGVRLAALIAGAAAKAGLLAKFWRSCCRSSSSPRSLSSSSWWWSARALALHQGPRQEHGVQ